MTNKKKYKKLTNPWSNTNSVYFYSTERNTIKELYPSEKYFLDKLVKPDVSVLDVGCAAGGFYNIFKEYDSSINYTGIDFSHELLHSAKINDLNSSFIVGGGNHLPFKNDTFDIVFCSGVMPITFDWPDILRECWRVTKQNFIFDVRLIESGNSIENIEESYQRIAFFNEWDGYSVVPYIILNINDFCTKLSLLEPYPAKIDSYGYMNKVSEMAVTPYKEVCMAMWSLSKIKQIGQNTWNIPIKKIKS